MLVFNKHCLSLNITDSMITLNITDNKNIRKIGKSAAGKISGGNSYWEELFQGRNNSLKTVLVQYWKLELVEKREITKIFFSLKINFFPKGKVSMITKPFDKSTKSTKRKNSTNSTNSTKSTKSAKI